MIIDPARIAARAKLAAPATVTNRLGCSELQQGGAGIPPPFFRSAWLSFPSCGKPRRRSRDYTARVPRCQGHAR